MIQKQAFALKKKQASWLMVATVFLIFGMVVLINLEPPRGGVNKPLAKEPPAPRGIEPPRVTATPESAVPPSATPTPEASAPAPPSAAPPSPPPPPLASEPSSAPAPLTAASPVGEADIAALKLKALLIPVAGVRANQLRDTFNDGRSEGRQHEALDIMAAAGTPVLAAADGKVVRLFQSQKGGITLYQADSSGLYFYYYAHLQRYADGVSEGKDIKRGDVIAYVGDTGNAGAGNYHLHFAISKPLTPGKWSGGAPINPYPFFINP